MIRSVALLLLLSTWLASSRSSPYHASSGYPFTTTSEAAPAATGDAVSALPAGWEAHVDPSSGNTYFVNVATGETSWDPPVVGVSHAPGSEIPVSCPDDVSSAEEDVSYAAWEDEALGKENGFDNEVEREAELGVDVEAAHVQAAAAEAEAVGRSAAAAEKGRPINGWVGCEIPRSTVGAFTEPPGLVGRKANAGKCRPVKSAPYLT